MKLHKLHTGVIITHIHTDIERAFIALFLFPKNLLYIRYIYMKYELNVPTSLNEITLGQYQQYLKLPEGLTENQVALKMVGIFCQVPDTVVRNIKAADIQTRTLLN
jgi:hypothetical protein